MVDPLWSPSAERVAKSQMTAFTRFVEARIDRSFQNWPDLYRWSVQHNLQFWSIFADFAKIIWDQPSNLVFRGGPTFRHGRWFPGAHLNFAKNILANLKEGVVLASYEEGKTSTSFSDQEFKRQVASLALGLRRLGVAKGDRVCGMVTNGPEAILGMLATASLGAVWASCSPDFGAEGALDRLGQLSPKVLFATKEYQYNSKLFDCRSKVNAIQKQLGAATKVIFLGDEFTSFIKDQGEAELYFESVEFSDPLYILFSSGTTGIPKGIVHGVGGTLLQHRKEHLLHCDLRRDDCLFFFTTCGWMMWNWLATGLGSGAKLVTFDGSPTFPKVETLFDICDEEQITAFGLSPRYLATLKSLGCSPKVSHKLNSLRTILSTGSVLSEDLYRYVYQHIKEDIHLASISGGTDIVSCFILGNPNLPVYAGEVQGPGLGMAVEAWTAEGKPGIGEKGEMVCTKPFVSMPVYFLNDADGSCYQKSYFTHYPGKDVWRHGDFISIDKDFRIQIFGRSDATLNPSGVRIGTSEIYRCVESIDGIKDCVVVGYEIKEEVYVILFVVMTQGVNFSQSFADSIAKTIRVNLSPRHVPAKIFAVTEIPYTLNGKKVELAVKNTIHRQPVANLSSLLNPKVLAEYEPYALKLEQIFQEA